MQQTLTFGNNSMQYTQLANGITIWVQFVRIAHRHFTQKFKAAFTYAFWTKAECL